MSAASGPGEHDEAAKLVINDKRRIDPETGAVRAAPAGAAHPSAAPSGGPDSPGFAVPEAYRRSGAGTPLADASGPAASGPGAGSPGAGSPGAGSPGAGAEFAPEEDALSAADQIAVLQMEVAERTQDLQRVQAEYLNYRRRVDRDRDAARDHAVGGVVLDLLPVLDDIGRAAEHGELVGGFKSVADALNGVLAKLGVQLFGEPGEPFDPSQHEALLHTYSDEVTETTAVQVFQPGYRLRDRVLRPARVLVADPTEALPEPPERGGPGLDGPELGGLRLDGPGLGGVDSPAIDVHEPDASHRTDDDQ